MTKKRFSLHEIAKEDEQSVVRIETPPPDMKHEGTVSYSQSARPQMKGEASRNTADLSEYTKMSVTVAVDVFEKLQDISRQRRRAKQPFKLTELVREALTDWLPKQP